MSSKMPVQGSGNTSGNNKSGNKSGKTSERSVHFQKPESVTSATMLQKSGSARSATGGSSTSASPSSVSSSAAGSRSSSRSVPPPPAGNKQQNKHQVMTHYEEFLDSRLRPDLEKSLEKARTVNANLEELYILRRSIEELIEKRKMDWVRDELIY
jgi:hypothetical protein